MPRKPTPKVLLAVSADPAGVYLVVDNKLTLSTTRTTCADCGIEGWLGSFPHEGGIVAAEFSPNEPICDDCAEGK